LNFRFETDIGSIDIFGEVGGLAFWEEVKQNSFEANALGLRFWVLDLEPLTKAKKFAGRKKDEPVILELEAIQELLQRKHPD
jgi:hypothetical protein